MRLAVHDEAGGVLIELDGIAGRHYQVLKVLAELRDGVLDGFTRPTELAVRSGSDAMKIRLRGNECEPIAADAIYGLLRRLLVRPVASTSLADAPSP